MFLKVKNLLLIAIFINYMIVISFIIKLVVMIMGVYKEQIQKAIDYIEENLQNEIDLSACAKAAGYSSYHFLRIFKEATNLTPGDYIRKRRLSETAKEIMSGSGCVSQIAFMYGFNSKENFIRAFKSEHGILPTEYKKIGNSLKLYEKITFDEKCTYKIEPYITTLDDFEIVAYPCDEDYVPKFWNKYNCRKLSKRLSGGATCEDYGVTVVNPEFQYYIGIRSEFAKGNTENTILVEIPKGTYAVFQTPAANHFNFVNTIHETWMYINRVWLPNRGYEIKNTPSFETYIEESRSFSEKIFIPIIKGKENML